MRRPKAECFNRRLKILKIQLLLNLLAECLTKGLTKNKSTKYFEYFLLKDILFSQLQLLRPLMVRERLIDSDKLDKKAHAKDYTDSSTSCTQYLLSNECCFSFFIKSRFKNSQLSMLT